MSPAGKLIVGQGLSEFFYGEVARASGHLGVSLSETTGYYLVNLLCGFSHRDPSGPQLGAEPLAFIYQRAHEASGDERPAVLKELGDVALYTSGFFTDSIERSLVDIDYYIAMGGTAYRALAEMVAGHAGRRGVADMYRSMASDFTTLVDVLNDIADAARGQRESDLDLLRLYDRWARTGSERIRRLLQGRGLPTLPDLPTDFRH